MQNEKCHFKNKKWKKSIFFEKFKLLFQYLENEPLNVLTVILDIIYG